MNTENNSPEEITPEVAPQGPGLLLRNEREKQGLSVEEIAARLNLRAHNINDIENETFDPKVSTTFIKGYLKAYARILGITEEQILSAYYRLGIAESKYAQMQSFSQRTQQEAHNNRLTWISYAIGAGLVGMLVWWWLQKASLEPATSEQLVNESVIVSDEAEVPTRSLPIAEQVSEDSEAVLPEEVPAQEPESVEGETELNSDEALETETTETTATPVATTPEPSNKADLSALEVGFTFSNDCWIKVTDADDKTLAIGVKEKGSTLSLTGKAPFKLTIGAPKAVEITYNNRTFDMTQFKAGKIARFELPEKE
ncbi:DUF4115 domain-containing protein [Motilimonas sp. 1_MG-2023]|uniref:RodZ domain-containing protein n=1 Tax=Motilimonas sp. 1_MG-2023 TaxID=3062672 RepID=UPI0026E33104|nr:RodZ domain-containing protein [Motilimonas sp. 1_MG-2023]MDO6528001.1 DUF4115 domain-containing protein [Motilimonas sp. 1_MG-2023]